MGQQTETTQSVQHSGEYGDLQHSRDFGDKRIYPDAAELQNIHEYWSERQLDPDCSERSSDNIQLILSRLSFELMMRKQEG